jgi:hypothetical protein
VNFLRGGHGIGQVLENIEGKNTVERPLAKWKVVRVAHDISVPENLVLELDAIRIPLRGPARANIQDEIIAGAQDGFVFRSDRIAAVVRSDQLEWLGQKNGNGIADRERAGTALTTKRIAFLAKRTTTLGTNQNVFYARAYLRWGHLGSVREANAEASARQ